MGTRFRYTFSPVERFLLNDDDPVVVAAIKEMRQDVKTRKAARNSVAAQAKKAAQKRMKPETEKIQMKSPKTSEVAGQKDKPLRDAGHSVAAQPWSQGRQIHDKPRRRHLGASIGV